MRRRWQTIMAASRMLGGRRGGGPTLQTSTAHGCRAARGRGVRDGGVLRWYVEQAGIPTDSHHSGQCGKSRRGWRTRSNPGRMDQSTAVAKDRRTIAQHPWRRTGPVGRRRSLGSTYALVVCLQILVGTGTGIPEHARGCQHAAALLVGTSGKWEKYAFISKQSWVIFTYSRCLID